MSLKYRFLAGLLACLALSTVWAAPQAPAPGLDKLLTQVWETHPGIQAAQSAVEAARARAEAAGMPIYNPELEVDAEKTDVNTLSVGINQTIDWGDKRGAQRQMGSADVQVAQAELAQLRLQIGSEVLAALARYQNARDLERLAQRYSRLIEQMLLTTEQRYAAGDTSQLDVAMARVALSEARMQLARRSTEVATQHAALVAASGLDLGQWPHLPAQSPAPPAEPPREELLARLPAVISQQARIHNAKASIDLARAVRKPDPTLGLRGGAEDSELLLGLNFSMPLNIRNRFVAEVNAATEETVQQEKVLLDLYRRAAIRFDGALSVYRITHKAWRQWQDQGQSQLSLQMALIQQMWEAHELSTIDYLLQTGQNIGSQITATELNGELWQAWIDWLNASGQTETWARGESNVK